MKNLTRRRLLQTAAAAAMADAGVRKRLNEQRIRPSGADELEKFMAQEVKKYRSVVKAAKITAD
jgi:tripartite-type tricarboxylate transporter receptor subunit TctC